MPVPLLCTAARIACLLNADYATQSTQSSVTGERGEQLRLAAAFAHRLLVDRGAMALRSGKGIARPAGMARPALSPAKRSPHAPSGTPSNETPEEKLVRLRGLLDQYRELNQEFEKEVDAKTEELADKDAIIEALHRQLDEKDDALLEANERADREETLAKASSREVKRLQAELVRTKQEYAALSRTISAARPAAVRNGSSRLAAEDSLEEMDDAPEQTRVAVGRVAHYPSSQQLARHSPGAAIDANAGPSRRPNLSGHKRPAFDNYDDSDGADGQGGAGGYEGGYREDDDDQLGGAGEQGAGEGDEAGEDREDDVLHVSKKAKPQADGRAGFVDALPKKAVGVPQEPSPKKLRFSLREKQDIVKGIIEQADTSGAFPSVSWKKILLNPRLQFHPRRSAPHLKDAVSERRARASSPCAPLPPLSRRRRQAALIRRPCRAAACARCTVPHDPQKLLRRRPAGAAGGQHRADDHARRGAGQLQPPQGGADQGGKGEGGARVHGRARLGSGRRRRVEALRDLCPHPEGWRWRFARQHALHALHVARSCSAHAHPAQAFLAALARALCFDLFGWRDQQHFLASARRMMIPLKQQLPV